MDERDTSDHKDQGNQENKGDHDHDRDRDWWAEHALRDALDKVTAQRTLAGYPHITEQGHWVLTPDGAWTGGFWIGLLWAAFAASGDAALRARAEELLQRFMLRATEPRNHDLGMMFCPSAVAGWQITGDVRYRQAALQAAESLAAQVHPQGHFIPGWGFFGNDDWRGAVLVDTLMNLPLLVWASEQTGDTRYCEIAVAHANTTLRQHLRPDGSTYHVYRFDPGSGAPRGGDTYQGRAPESCWSRGQAWALTGFALLAHGTGEDRYRRAAQRAARYYLDHLPPDGVPCWDFAVPVGDGPRDSSAAAIASYGLLRLAELDATADQRNQRDYREAVYHTLHSLSTGYTAAPHAPALLVHATADLPHGLGIDGSTVYGDYFYVQALQALVGQATPRRAGGCL